MKDLLHELEDKFVNDIYSQIPEHQKYGGVVPEIASRRHSENISAVVDKAIADGMRGIAVTDHGNMFAIKEFWNYVKKKNGARRDKVKQTSAAIADLQAKVDAMLQDCKELSHMQITLGVLSLEDM